MSVIAKKVCMVGPFAVGKTSLVQRFVESIFSDKYHTTIGVKISKKQLQVNDHHVQMMLWDLEGVDVFTELRPSYLRGAAGVMVVVDGTRPATLNQIDHLMELVKDQLNDVPIIVLINKSDLATEWKLDSEAIAEYEANGLSVFKTSAKTGESVEDAFEALANIMIEQQSACQP